MPWGGTRRYLGDTLAANHSAGFTLVETLLYQALLLLILTLAVLFLVPSLRLQSRGLVQAERLRGGHLLMDRLCRDLRETPQTCLSFQNNLLCGRRSQSWSSEGDVLLEDQGWFFDLTTCRSALLSWQHGLGLAQTWKEPLSLAQIQSCQPHLKWRRLIAESAHITFSSAANATGKPQGPYTVAVRIGDLDLQQTVQPRQLR